MRNYYRAAWSNKLISTTGIILAILAAVAWQSFRDQAFFGVALISSIIAVTLAFSIRGYSVTDKAVIVHRFGWKTTLPIDGMLSAEIDPAATVSSIRTFGIGGLFGFVGKFRNQRLGNYTAYVTNGMNSIVIRYPDKTIVISPSKPTYFYSDLAQKLNPD